jgi:hypothetical protein
MLGLPDDLTVGAEANFNVYSAGGQRMHTMLRGRLL